MKKRGGGRLKAYSMQRLCNLTQQTAATLQSHLQTADLSQACSTAVFWWDVSHAQTHDSAAKTSLQQFNARKSVSVFFSCNLYLDNQCT